MTETTSFALGSSTCLVEAPTDQGRVEDHVPDRPVLVGRRHREHQHHQQEAQRDVDTGCNHLSRLS